MNTTMNPTESPSTAKAYDFLVDSEGYYGEFGGAYIPEILHQCVDDLRQNYLKVLQSDDFKQAYFQRIESLGLRNPRMVGFGISNKQTFDAACAHASGAIIGSRFVTLLNEAQGDANQAIERLKKAING